MSRSSANRLLILLAVVVGAVVCYAAGFGLGITLFVVAGVVFELAFWILAFTGPARSGKAP